MQDSNHKDGGHGEFSREGFEVSSNVGSASAVKTTF